MPKSLCNQPSCQYVFIGSNPDSHRKEFHSAEHKFPYNGKKVKVCRRLDGKLPCPCGSELHARYSFKKLTALTRLRQHPLPEESPHADHDVTDSDTLPPSSFSISTSSVDGPMKSTPCFDSSTLSTSETSLAVNAEDIEMEEAGTYQGTGEPLREVVVETGAEGADDPQFGGKGDVSEAGPDSDEGSEYPDEIQKAADEENELDEMDVAATSTPVIATQAHSLLAKFNVVVDPVYRLTICTECNKPVPFNHMRQHQWQTHYKGLNLLSELHLPSKAVVLSLLVGLGADRPREIPYQAIPRIQGIETVLGYRCLNSGCGGAVFGKSRSMRRHHADVHPDVEVGNRQSIRVSCQPLSVFRRNLRYVEIIPDPEIKSLALLAIEHSASTCNLLETPQVFNVTSNEREKNAVFAQSRWDELLEGVNITDLRKTISTPDLHALTTFERLTIYFPDPGLSPCQKTIQ